MTPFESPFQSKPPLASCTAVVKSSATVPLLTLGINPLGPKNLARAGFLVNKLRSSGVVMSLSGLSSPLRISATSSSPPTRSAPAARASLAWAPVAKTTMKEVLVRDEAEWGRKTRPRRALSWIVEAGLVRMLIS